MTIKSLTQTVYQSELDPNQGFTTEQEALAHEQSILRDRFIGTYVKAKDYKTQIGQRKALNFLNDFMRAYRNKFESVGVVVNQSRDSDNSDTDTDQPTGSSRRGENGNLVT